MTYYQIEIFNLTTSPGSYCIMPLQTLVESKKMFDSFQVYGNMTIKLVQIESIIENGTIVDRKTKTLAIRPNL